MSTSSNLVNLKKTVTKVIRQQRFARNIKSISVFGSVARGEDSVKSDIDLIVDFLKPVGLFYMAGLKNALEDEFKKKVDLVGKGSFRPHVVKSALKDAIKIYEK
jgi:uncharacterized protein